VSPACSGHARQHLVERGLTLELVFHAEAFAFDDHGVGVMQQSVQNGGRQRAVIIEDLGPLLEGAVRGDNDCPLLIAQRDDLEEQIGARLVDGEVAEFVE